MIEYKQRCNIFNNLDFIMKLIYLAKDQYHIGKCTITMKKLKNYLITEIYIYYIIMLKSLINTFLNLHHQNNSIIDYDIYHYAFNKPSLSNNIYIFSNSRNKLKCALMILSRIQSKHFYALITFTTLAQLSY